MEEVRLETAQGEFVVTGVMPLFTTLPVVVLWGQRVFRLVPVRMEGASTVYREVFAITIVETKKD